MQQNFSGQQQQNQQQPTGQPIMQEPPDVLTSKDMAYLKDAMSWELVAMKKCHHFAQECTSPKIREAIDRAGQMHQQHYQKLLSHVNPNNSLQMSNQNQFFQ